jgi:hypothetical protein
VCESRIIKLEIILRSGEGRMIEEVNLIKIYYKHKCKCHKVFSLYNYYTQIKKFKKIVSLNNHVALLV